MKPSPLDQLINAVLYEGYILYPYRPSSKKNQQRFTFGRVYPQAYGASQDGAEPFVMQTECLVRSQSGSPLLKASVRFLHPMMREVGQELAAQSASTNSEPFFKVVSELRVEGNVYHTWQEAVEREVKPLPLSLRAPLPGQMSFPFSFPASLVEEPIRDQQDCAAGIIRRRQGAIEGMVELNVQLVDAAIFKITIRILNHTPMTAEEMNDQGAVIMRTLASTHTILHVEGGEFISQTDPPSVCREAVAGCRNIGTWPVLVGDEEKAECDTMLSSPIILSDYPRIAPESAGDLFDGAEIDEILTLRIMTMTDEEKQEMRGVDEHARRLLDRTETLDQDHLLKMHGVMRANRSFDESFFGTSTRLEGVSLGDIYLRAGDQVRIQPRVRADAIDMMLTGKTAVIEAVEQDAEGKIHLALVLSDDPGKDLGLLRQPGHRFFYALDEIEPLKEGK
jgi:hypothetical protein